MIYVLEHIADNSQYALDQLSSCVMILVNTFITFVAHNPSFHMNPLYTAPVSFWNVIDASESEAATNNCYSS